MTDEQRVEIENDTQDFLRKLHEVRVSKREYVDQVETNMAYYIKMFDTVRQMQYCSHTFEELKTYYTKQINKCLEELNAE